MELYELDSLKKGINKLLYRNISFFKNRGDFQHFDFSELDKNLTEDSTVEEMNEYLEEFIKIWKVQDKIISDATEKFNQIIAEEYNIRTRNHKIYNGGNYYIVTMAIGVQNYGNSFYKTFSSVYNKEGQLLLPFDKEIKDIDVLDDNNFLVIPTSNDKEIKHYRVDKSFEKISIVYSWDNISKNDRRAHNINFGEWHKKGLMAITHQGREYLYSYLEGKVLSYGYTTIDVFDKLENEDIINYTKNFNCCKVSLKISSDLPSDEDNLDISTTLTGYIDSKGELINGLLDLSNGKRYQATKGKEHILEKAIKEEFNEMAESLQQTKKLIAENQKIMIKELEKSYKK